jgi:GMP synthase (glutamine-hydrolysing)
MPGIAVLDSGGQYCHLIARRVREFGVFSQILPLDISASELEKFEGIIISGGPRSVYEQDAPRVRTEVLELGKPLLGICYGQQLMAQLLGGEVRPGTFREYGTASLTILQSNTIFSRVPSDEPVWMSHGDAVQKLPPGFQLLAHTEDCRFAAIANFDKRIYGLQFHPEVTHTRYGSTILRNFLFGICHAEKSWNPAKLKEKLVKTIRKVAAGRKVYFLVSGGVDSTVAYTLCAQALPKENLEGLYVDTGFMRKNESDELRTTFKRLGLPNINVIDASDRFLKALANIIDPEQKRNSIGQLFFKVQEEIIESLESQNKNWVLGQGTIYPDTIESGGTSGSAIIKTHHNRVPVITELARQKRLVEPLRELYKDEVRELGRALGLPEDLVNRHPFPGPGLAIRTLGTDNKEAEPQYHNRMMDVCKKYDLQGCTLPLRSVGVQGDGRSYADIAIIAGKANLKILSKVSTEITNRCIDVNRVVYCLDSAVDLTALHVHEAFITKKRVELLREADAIAHQVLAARGLTNRVWQFPVVLIPVSREAYRGESVVLRPVHSIDGMTAEFAKLPIAVLRIMSKEITKLNGIDLVFFDVSNKPPATIEWE